MFFSLLSLLVSSQVALGSIGRRVTPLPPAQDPFYRPPPGFENAAPGTILASRPAPAKLEALSLFPLNIKSVTQLLYRTTGSQGQPEVTVSTVIVPSNADYGKVVSYQVAEDSGGQINCAPSYTLQTGSQSIYAGTALSSGNITGVKKDAKVQMWGYSGGALASEWAMELQQSYAPELKFVGAAIGGVTPNVPNVYTSINHGPFAGLAAAGLLGLANAFPDFEAALNKQIIPATSAQFHQAGTNCFYGDTVLFALQNISLYFYDGDNIINEPTLAKYFNSNCQMGLHGTPQMPLFVYKSQFDEISPIADTDALVQQFCRNGVSVTYVRDYAGEHFTQAATSFPDVINFLRARFD